MSAQPTQQQLLAGWVTTTLFEGFGLFCGAVVIAISRAFDLPILGFIGLAVWFLSLWAENYSVAEIVSPTFGLSKPISIFAMGAAEFATWTIWLLLLHSGLPWLVLLVTLLVLTQIHHAIQFCFFYPDSNIGAGMRSPLLWLASAIEAVAGQGLLALVLVATSFDASTLVPLLVGLLVIFAVEHLVGGQVKPA